MTLELALFDLDHTLLPIDSDHSFGDYMEQQGLVGREYKQQNDRFYEDYLAGRLDIVRYQRATMAPLLGLSAQQLDQLHQDYMIAKIVPNLRDEALELVRQHQRRGDLCAIVTATNSYVTAPIARAFGIEHLIASVAAMEGGRFTGELRGIAAYREGKVTRVDAWLETMALSMQNLQRTTFYSDSHNDLPLLEAVTDPVATNPDDTLRAEALQRGWRILDLFDRP
jgi:HAD superfamily hydrolase (TIGR01490 family)